MGNVFSFIIPVYNNDNYIEDCVISILNSSGNQSNCSQIIIIDDGSSDMSAALCDMIAITNEHDNCSIVVCHQPNQGVSAARNIGIKAAVGCYVSFADSDDFVESEKLAECMDQIAYYTEIDMLVFGMSFDYYNKEKKYRNDKMLPAYAGAKSYLECIEDIDCLFDRNMLSSLCTRIIRKNIVDDLYLYEDMFLFEDLEFSLRVLKRCKKVYFFNDVVYHYRQDEKNKERIRRISDTNSITDRISQDLKELGVESQYIVKSMESYFSMMRQNAMSYSELKAAYPGKAFSFMLKHFYSKTRHTLAEHIKRNIGDFRKWKL